MFYELQPIIGWYVSNPNKTTYNTLININAIMYNQDFLVFDWLVFLNAITFHKHFQCSQTSEFHSIYNIIFEKNN